MCIDDVIEAVDVDGCAQEFEAADSDAVIGR